MVWPNPGLIVLPLSLPLPSSRAFLSSCIINKPLISDRCKLCKYWRFLPSSHPLTFVAAVGHPPGSKRRVHRSLVPVYTHMYTRYSKSQCLASARNTSVLRTRLPYCCAYWWGKAQHLTQARLSHARRAYKSRAVCTVVSLFTAPLVGACVVAT